MPKAKRNTFDEYDRRCLDAKYHEHVKGVDHYDAWDHECYWDSESEEDWCSESPNEAVPRYCDELGEDAVKAAIEAANGGR